MINKIQESPEEHCLKVKIEMKFKDRFIIQCFNEKCDENSKKVFRLLNLMTFRMMNKEAHCHYLSFEKITENEFIKSENQYLEIAGQLKGPYKILCLKCAVLSKNFFEFKRHLETHEIDVPPYECFVQNPKSKHKCDYKSKKDHFYSLLEHYNAKHVKVKSSALDSNQFEGLYKSKTEKSICNEPVGCFVELYDFKSLIKSKKENKIEDEECNENVKYVKSEISFEKVLKSDLNEIKKKINLENKIQIVEPENHSEDICKFFNSNELERTEKSVT